MAQLQIEAQIVGPTVEARQNFFVQTKSAWSGAWVKRNWLYPIDATLAAAPTVGRASFGYDFGDMKRSDKNAFSQDSQLDLSDHYISIAEQPDANDDPNTEPKIIWVGIITDLGSGYLPAATTEQEQGTHKIHAYTLEHSLSRIAIDGGWVKEGANVVKIGWTPVFNQRSARGQSQFGNRSDIEVNSDVTLSSIPIVPARKSYAFGDDDEEWSNKNIVEYILGFHGAGTEFKAKLSGQTEILDKIYETHDISGLTVLSAINVLIPRHRGISWRVVYDSTADDGGVTNSAGTPVVSVGIEVFSILHDTIGSIPASNRITGELAVDDNKDISITINESTSTQYDEIIVQGERARVCFSVSVPDTNLEKSWDAAIETLYKAGATTVVDKTDHDDYRRTDKFERVYQVFRIPQDWDWKSGNGQAEPTADQTNLSLTFDDAGGLIITDGNPTQGKYWNYGRHLCGSLPLEKLTDATSAEPEFLKPMLFLRGKDSADADKWFQADRIPSNAEGGPVAIRMLSREFGFQARPKINHSLAKNHFTMGTDMPTKTAPVFDYATEMIATVCTECDNRIRVKWSRGSGQRVLVIPVRGAHYWYIAPKAIVGEELGKLVQFGDSNYTFNGTGIARDDSSKLRSILEDARAWYVDKRRTATITYTRVTQDNGVGTVIKTASVGLKKVTLNTPVSSVHWKFGATNTTTINTSFSEIDFERMAGNSNVSDARRIDRMMSMLDEMQAERDGNFDRPQTVPDTLELMETTTAVVSNKIAAKPSELDGTLVGLEVDFEAP